MRLYFFIGSYSIMLFTVKPIVKPMDESTRLQRMKSCLVQIKDPNHGSYDRVLQRRRSRTLPKKC